MTRTLKIFLPCTGLARQQRGFETFTRELAGQLRTQPELDVRVFAGGPSEFDETYVRNLPRTSPVNVWLSQVSKRDPHRIEQATFFVGLLPYIEYHKPDIIYFADVNLGNLCWHWRRWRGGAYRLLMFNGGPSTMPYTRCELVQEVTLPLYESAIGRGEVAERLELLPHALRAERRPVVDKPELRRRLGLPVATPIVLSVGAIGASHKGMDRLIRELAALPSPRPHLVMLGQHTHETPAIVELGNTLLGASGWTMRTVPRESVWDYYDAADLFVLASLHEGFGLVYLEAARCGLPVICHDFPVSRWVLDRHAHFADLRVPGNLRALVAKCLAAPESEVEREERRSYVERNFSWEVLLPRYVSMFKRCAAMPLETKGALR